MFFLKEEERTVTLHPSFFGPHIETYIRNQLFHDVEGQILGDYFTICVLDNIHISEGKVIPGSAFAEFTVHYRAIVWKPFKGEVVDGTVGTCIEAGFFVDIGPLQAFVESGVSFRILCSHNNVCQLSVNRESHRKSSSTRTRRHHNGRMGAIR
jgi:DNA-directed RNA polymerase II subunit RPB7